MSVPSKLVTRPKFAANNPPPPLSSIDELIQSNRTRPIALIKVIFFYFDTTLQRRFDCGVYFVRSMRRHRLICTNIWQCGDVVINSSFLVF